MKLTALFLSLLVPSVAAADPIVLKLATVAPEGSPWAQGLADFKKAVEEAHPGKIKVKPFLGGTLGDEIESVQSTKRGQVQAFGGSTGAIAALVPEVNVLELPYLFNNYAECDYIIDSVAGPMLKKALEDRGLVVGFWSENGFRNFGGKFAVNSLADLKGRKMRSQESPIHLEMYRAFGASPVPIPTTEALTSLQTGVVDGYDQAPIFTFAASWHTASTNYSISEHIYQAGVIVYNKAFYDALPTDIRATMVKSGNDIIGPLRTQIRALTPILIENLKASNVKVNVLDDKQRAEFQKVAAKMREDWAKKASPSEKKLYDAIVKGLKDLRAKKK